MRTSLGKIKSWKYGNVTRWDRKLTCFQDLRHSLGAGWGAQDREGGQNEFCQEAPTVFSFNELTSLLIPHGEAHKRKTPISTPHTWTIKPDQVLKRQNPPNRRVKGWKKNGTNTRLTITWLIQFYTNTKKSQILSPVCLLYHKHWYYQGIMEAFNFLSFYAFNPQGVSSWIHARRPIGRIKMV